MCAKRILRFLRYRYDYFQGKEPKLNIFLNKIWITVVDYNYLYELFSESYFF
jgi:hypothetical protein